MPKAIMMGHNSAAGDDGAEDDVANEDNGDDGYFGVMDEGKMHQNMMSLEDTVADGFQTL